MYPWRKENGEQIWSLLWYHNTQAMSSHIYVYSDMSKSYKDLNCWLFTSLFFEKIIMKGWLDGKASVEVQVTNSVSLTWSDLGPICELNIIGSWTNMLTCRSYRFKTWSHCSVIHRHLYKLKRTRKDCQLRWLSLYFRSCFQMVFHKLDRWSEGI